MNYCLNYLILLMLGQVLFFHEAKSSEKKSLYQQISRDSLNVLLKKSNSLTHHEPLESRALASQLLQYAKNNDWLYEQAQAYQTIGTTHNVGGEYDLALENFMNAYQLFEMLADTTNMTRSLGSIGIVYKHLQDYPMSLAYYRKTLKINSPEDTLIRSKLFNNMGVVYKRMKNYDTAIYYFEKSMVLKELLGNGKGVANTLSNLGNIASEKGDQFRAIELFNEALKIERRLNINEGIAKSLNNIALVFLKLEQYDSAIIYASQGLQISKSINTKIQIKEATAVLTKAHYEKGDYKNAYSYQQLNYEVRDSLSNEVMARNIGQLESKLELEKKNSHIDNLEQLNLISQLESEREKQYRLLLIVGLVFLFIVILFLFIRYQSKKKTSEILDAKNQELSKLNNTKDRLFSIISHDLKSPLSSFHTITKSLSDNWENLEKDQLKDFIITLRDSSSDVKNMMENLLKWALAQTGELTYLPQQVTPSEIIEKVRNQLEPVSHIKKISIKEEIAAHVSISADQQFLEIVIRNLLSNAVKFSKIESEIKVSISSEGNSVVISIQDYGVGMDQTDIELLLDGSIVAQDIQNSSEKGTGLGLTLCKELITKMGAEMKVLSEKGKGTTFKLVFAKAA